MNNPSGRPTYSAAPPALCSGRPDARPRSTGGASMLRASTEPWYRDAARAAPSASSRRSAMPQIAGFRKAAFREKGAKPGVRIFLAFLAILALAPALSAQEPWRTAGVARLVVVPDVHGAYGELVRLLQATGVIDDSLAWSGGETQLVSLGDLLDRGPDSRQVMDLLKRLQREAREQGGAVHVVLGNHEAMNLLGDLRYVSAEEYASYAQDESDEVREAAFAWFADRQDDTLPEEEALAAFERRYPAGYFAHRLAFRPDGEYGSWLLSLPALVQIGEVVFVHAGLSELVSHRSVEALNRQVQELLRRNFSLREQLVTAGVLPPWELDDDLRLVREAQLAMSQETGGGDAAVAALIEEFISLRAAPELGMEGPLWYRGAPYCNAFVEKHVLEAALAALGARRVVVGHTVSEDRHVRELYDGRVIMLDTGMLAEYYSGRPAALIIEQGSAVVQYLDPEGRGSPERGRIEAYGLTDAQILEALAKARIEAVLPVLENAAWQRVQVRHAGHVLEGIFRSNGQRREAELELAAFALDRLLGLGLVPPTVARAFEGRDGSLQLHYPNTIYETQRLQADSPLGEWCSIEPQVDLMTAFDFVIGNRRTTDGVMFRPEFPTIKLTDHAQAFGTGTSEPRLPADFVVPRGFGEALAALDGRALQGTLGEWLEVRQMRALLARRDALLARATSR